MILLTLALPSLLWLLMLVVFTFVLPFKLVVAGLLGIGFFYAYFRARQRPSAVPFLSFAMPLVLLPWLFIVSYGALEIAVPLVGTFLVGVVLLGVGLGSVMRGSARASASGQTNSHEALQ